MNALHHARTGAILLASGLFPALPAHAALVLTFSDSVGHPLPIDNSPCGDIAWIAGAEFRLCNPTGTALGTNAPHQKSIIAGGEQWIFDHAGNLTGVSGTPGNLGTGDEWDDYPGSAAPVAGTNPSLHQHLPLIGLAMNLLAPVQGSLAATAYGTGVSFVDEGGLFPGMENVPFLHFPVLEMQWGVWLPLGQASGGVTFYADIYNVVASSPAPGQAAWYGFDFHLHASEYVDDAEDPFGTGLAGWTLQWELQGHGVYTSPHVPEVPVPAAAWLFGSGLIGLIASMRRRVG